MAYLTIKTPAPIRRGRFQPPRSFIVWRDQQSKQDKHSLTFAKRTDIHGDKNTEGLKNGSDK